MMVPKTNHSIRYYILKFLIIPILIVVASCDLSNKSNSTNQNPEWANELITAYRALNKSRTIQSADLVFNATEKMPKKNWENYFVCAMVYSTHGNIEKAYLSIENALEHGFRDVELLESIPEFNSLKKGSKWNLLIAEAEKRNQEYLLRIESPQLFKELEHLWEEDQKALTKYELDISLLENTATSAQYQKLFEPVEKRWQTNKEKLDSIVEVHGWPGNNLVGEDGAKIAWSIAQHHPDVFFKQKCLKLIKEEVAKGNVTPNHYAELSDRIARDTWQKQTFGASMGNTAPHPIKNVSKVNARRIELGLHEPIEVYALYHGIDYEIPSQEETDSIYQKAQADYQKFENLFISGNVDSSVVHLNKAIDAHGDVTNDQLLSAALKLAQTNTDKYQNLSLRIIKVLIWRKWANRFSIPNYSEFNSLKKKEEWIEVQKLLDLSKT